MFQNRKHSAETKLRMRLARLGKKRTPFSEEWKKNLSKSLVGNKHTLGHKLTAEHRKKISDAVRGEKHPLFGIAPSEETRLKSSKSHSGQKAWNKGVYSEKVESSPRDLIRNSFKMKAWVFDVLRRDGFTCQDCGDDRGGNLEVDHIVPFSYLINSLKKYWSGVKLVAAAMEYEPLWNLSNGRTLCKECHKKTPTYGNNAKYYQPLSTIIK